MQASSNDADHDIETELMERNGEEEADDETQQHLHHHHQNSEDAAQELLIPTGGDDVSTKKRTTSSKKGEEAAAATAGGKKVKKKVRKDPAAAAGSAVAAGGSGDEHATALLIKYMALFLLVAQMVGLVLLMRYSRTIRDPEIPLYLASTAVFIMEVMKLIICLGVIAFQSGGDLLGELNRHILESPMEILKLCVPSLLYTVQNNLLYLALTNLDAATYQVCYQLKILTTALFSSILLQRKFSPTKWASLVLLTVGVAIVQLSGSGDQHADADTAKERQNRLIGTIAVLCAACTSGFSGVYFEKILKGSRTSLWIRNVQMGLPSTLIAYLTIYFKDSQALAEQGFLGGYTTIVWTVVTVQAVGGLIVAVVVRYADNVLKVFATSFSIVVSCIISAFLFDFHPTLSFLVGASLVVTATVMYSSPEGVRKRQRKPVLPVTNSSKPRN